MIKFIKKIIFFDNKNFILKYIFINLFFFIYLNNFVFIENNIIINKYLCYKI